MLRRILASVLLFVYQVEFGDAVSMESCPLVAVENKETVIRCTGINSNDRVVWYRIKGSTVTDAGQCHPLPADCAPFLPAIMDLSRPSADVSTMTIPSATRSLFGGATIRCDTFLELTDTGSDSCQMDVIYPAQVTSVSVQHAHGTWKATGSCDVTKVFSSLGRYSCQWYRGTSQTSQSDLLSNTSYTTTEIPGDTDYRRGTCSFTADIPPTSGTYYYRVVVHPGGTENVSGPVTVVKASSPTITGCPPDSYVRENSTITCRCTANVGTPPGHLVWRKIKSTNNIINTGNVNVGQLDMTPQTLTRRDHDVTQFRCDVQWAVLVEGNTYTARVGYGPEATTLRLNSKFGNLTVMENESVVFDCQGNGRPTPNMVLVNQDSGVEVNNSQSSPLTHTVSRARCEDAAVYTCTASNGIGRDQQTTGTLHVNCKPRSDLSSLPTLNYINQTVTQSFDVIASPVPHQFTFTFSGSNCPGQEVKDANLSAACVSVSGSLYRSRCHVTVFSVNSPSAAGFYTVRVANTHGHQDFTFQLTLYEKETQSSDNAEDNSIPIQGLAEGLGTALVVILVCNVAFLVWLWRRGWKLPCADTPYSKTTDNNGSHDRRRQIMEMNSIEGNAGEEHTESQGQTPSLYEGLKTQEIGLVSQYSTLEFCPNSDNGRHKDEVYENSVSPGYTVTK